MFKIQIDVRCAAPYIEMLPGKVDAAECVVEDFVSRILLTSFEAVIVDKVAITFSHSSQMALHFCTIQMQVYCPEKATHLLEHLEGRLEAQIGSTVAQLFGKVQSIRVKLSFASPENVF